MAEDKKISELTETTSPSLSSYFPLIESGLNKKSTLENILKAVQLTKTVKSTITLSAANIIAKKVVYATAYSGASLGTNTFVAIIGGGVQQEGVDYECLLDGTDLVISWNAKNMDGIVVENTKLCVIEFNRPIGV